VLLRNKQMNVIESDSITGFGKVRRAARARLLS